MSDSVGKISLDLEVQSDISKQISNVSGMIGRNLKKSLDSSMKSTLDNMSKTTKSSLNNMTSNINNSLKSSMGKIKNTMKAVFSNMKNFKMPQVSFPKPTNMETPKASSTSTTASKRGPPIDANAISAQIDNVSRTLDNTNARIEQQKVKLAQLREAYATCFNPGRKNGLEEKILKTEASINRLTATSDKLGFKLADLDTQFAKASSGANSTSNNSSKLKNSLMGINNATNKASNGLKNLNNSAKKASNSMRSHSSNIGMIVRSMFTWGIVFPMVLRGLTAMGTGLLNSLKTNEQFATSLAQIKSNLMIAFTPIYNAILPAINALMSALSVATQYIASFISAIFGKTFNQSKQATQGLIDAKTAMGAYGESAKKAGKDAKDALGLAGFDEINALNSQNSDGDGGGGGASKVPELVTPSLDTSGVDSSMKKLVDKINAYFKTFNFNPLIESFNKVKAAVTPIVNNVGKILKWFFVEILDPLAHWTISNLIPAFLNLLAGALKVLNPILEVFMSVGKWLWDSFLQPIASWTGGIIVDVLNGLADMLGRIGDWISEHKPFVEDFVLVLGSFAAAWGIVTIALGVWNIVSGIATIVTGALGGAIAFLTSPIGIAIMAIGAIIAIGVLLYKHWDEIKAKAIEVWDYIKNKFSEFSTWMDSIFLTDWSKQFGFLGDIMNGLLEPVRSIWESIKQIFRGIIDFIEGVFTGDWSRAWKGVVNIFSGIMSGIAEVMKLPLNAVIGLINGAISGLNKISVDIPSWIPGLGGKSFGVNIPKIPYLAKGGIIDSPTLAMVGEAGKEAVVPLENNTQGLDLLASKLMERLGGVNTSSSNNSFGDGDLILQIDGSVIGKVALKQLRKMQRQGNITLIPT